MHQWLRHITHMRVLVLRVLKWTNNQTDMTRALVSDNEDMNDGVADASPADNCNVEMYRSEN